MDAGFDKFHSEQHSFSKLSEMDTLVFSIRITVLREDNGEMPTTHGASGGLITEEGVGIALSNLNNEYASIKVKFVQDGRINYIDNSKLLPGDVPDAFFSFTSSTAHLVIRPFPNAGSASALMYLHPPASINLGRYGRKGNGYFSIRDSLYLSRSTVVHEMGHVLRLVHTFNGARLYDNPSDPIENSPMIFSDRNTRELVIREDQEEGSVFFHLTNHETAGDRISDTPAWGRRNNTFPDPDDPDCFVYVNLGSGGVINCGSGFGVFTNTCEYYGNYIDYNGHELNNTDIGMTNFMSYTSRFCRNNFTEDQLLRQSMTIREDAVRVWDPSKGTQFVDSVQFWSTKVPIRNANILLRHKEDSIANGRYSQITSSTDGSFSAKLFDSSVKAKSIMLGRGAKNPEYVRESDTSYVIYNYSESDWLIDVTTNDIVWLTRYILGIESLNSFQKLSADVNRDGELSVFDIIGIRQLILGLEVEFIEYPSGPWQFVPEVVSQNPDFLGDPFNMLIDGTAYNNEAPYIRSDFFFTPVLGETTGFDGYKLGDVNGSSIDRLSDGIIPSGNCSEKGEGKLVSISSNTVFANNDTLIYQISPTSTEDISGFQVEIRFDNTKLELLGKQVGIGGDLVEKAAIEVEGIPYSTNMYIANWGNEIEKGAQTRVRLSYVFDGDGTKFSQNIAPSENMVELMFKTKEAGVNLSEAITVGNNIPFEVYQVDGCIIKEDFVSEIVGIQEEKSLLDSKESTVQEEFSMSISPNPITDRAIFFIKSPIDETYEITFYSMTTGEKISSISVETAGGSFYGTINTENLPKDVLLIRVKGPNTNYSTKLIKL